MMPDTVATTSPAQTAAKTTDYTDVDSQTRDRMLRIGQKNTAPELRVRAVLHALGYRYRIHTSGLPGRPDIVLPRHRKVIFINGCFWHGHQSCLRISNKLPRKNSALWAEKINRTRRRDIENVAALDALGWKSLTIWECEANDPVLIALQLLAFLDPA